jgi:uncharacterized protein YdhG (YjbR/CyaY superfamily)
MKVTHSDVDAYIRAFPPDVQVLLSQVRQTILDHAPEATETIAYAMPAYRLYKKPLVYFAGFARHIGLYATPSGHTAFAERLSQYKQGKGSVQFPLNQPLPLDLIADIVAFRVLEVLQPK